MGIRILIPRPRRRGHGLKTHKFVWVALGIAAWGTAYTLFGTGGFVGSVRARNHVERLEQAVETAESANEELVRQIDALRNDPREIERQAREQLYLAKPGEKVYLLPPLPDNDPSAAAGSPQPPGDENTESPERQ